jgi:hypothetical protein
MHLAYWRWRIKEEKDGGCHIPNKKSLIFLENSNVHSFVDGGSMWLIRQHTMLQISSVKLSARLSVPKR